MILIEFQGCGSFSQEAETTESCFFLGKFIQLNLNIVQLLNMDMIDFCLY